MNSVLTPAAWACAAIEAMLPPLDWLRYQIHIPWPSSAEPLTAPPSIGVGRRGTGVFGFGGGGAGPEIASGPPAPAPRPPPPPPPRRPPSATGRPRPPPT